MPDDADGACQAVYSLPSSPGINVRGVVDNNRPPSNSAMAPDEQLLLALRFGLILELSKHCVTSTLLFMLVYDRQLALPSTPYLLVVFCVSFFVGKLNRKFAERVFAKCAGK